MHDVPLQTAQTDEFVGAATVTAAQGPEGAAAGAMDLMVVDAQ